MTADRFHLDRRAGKLLGVCAGLARSTGVHVMLIRVAAVVLTLALLHGAGLVIYLLVGLIARDAPRGC